MKQILKYFFLGVAFSSFSISIAFSGSPADTLRHKKVNGIQVRLYKVKAKETWSSISRKNKVSVAFLMTVNNGIDNLKVGQIINIPVEEGSLRSEIPTTTVQPEDHAITSKYRVPVHHTIKKGETLYKISKFYNQPLDQLKSWNQLQGNELKVGQKLVVNYIYQYRKAAETENIGNSAEQPDPAVKSQASIDVKLPETQESAVSQPAEKLVASTENNPVGYYDDRLLSGSVSKSSTGRMIRQMNETGVASWIMDGEVNQNKYYALHRYAPVGTIVKVTNRMNGKYVFVKVVGLLPDTGDNKNLIIKISQAASNKINVLDSRFQAELSYGITE